MKIQITSTFEEIIKYSDTNFYKYIKSYGCALVSNTFTTNTRNDWPVRSGSPGLVHRDLNRVETVYQTIEFNYLFMPGRRPADPGGYKWEVWGQIDYSAGRCRLVYWSFLRSPSCPHTRMAPVERLLEFIGAHLPHDHGHLLVKDRFDGMVLNRTIIPVSDLLLKLTLRTLVPQIAKILEYFELDSLVGIVSFSMVSVQ